MTKCLQEFISVKFQKPFPPEIDINKPQQIFFPFLYIYTVLRNLTQSDFANI